MLHIANQHAKWRESCFTCCVESPRLPEWNPRPVYLSLLIGLSAVTLVQTLCSLGLLSVALPANFEGLGLSGRNSDVLLLLPLAWGMAWVELAVESRIWRGTVLFGAMAQVVLATFLSARYGRTFHPMPPALCLLLAWGVPECLRRWGKLLQLPVKLDFHFDESTESKVPPQPSPLYTQPSVAVIEPDIAHPDIAPIRVNATVLHCAIVNHAQLAESLQPAQCASFLNRLLTLCTETTHAYQGVSVRSDGEAFRGVFCPLLGAEEHPEAALQAAAAIRQRLASLSHECEVKFGQELDLRIGVSTGEILLTTLTKDGQSITGLGEAADWAQKLAFANTLYGSRILISARTGLLGGHSVERRPIDLLQRHLPPHPPEDVFELVALQNTLDAATMARLAQYRKGVAQFRARHWEAAKTLLLAARPQDRSDEALELLLQRIAENEARGPLPNRTDDAVGRR